MRDGVFLFAILHIVQVAQAHAIDTLPKGVTFILRTTTSCLNNKIHISIVRDILDGRVNGPPSNV